MKRNEDKKQEALNQALDALIEQTGHSPEVILGDGGVLAQMSLALRPQRGFPNSFTLHVRCREGRAEAKARALAGRVG